MSRANEVRRGTVRTEITFPTGWCCYLLLCADGSYYCGITSDLPTRISDHASGRGGGYAKETKPLALVWYSIERNRRAAADREKQVESWTSEKKRQLAAGKGTLSGLGRAVIVSLE